MELGVGCGVCGVCVWGVCVGGVCGMWCGVGVWSMCGVCWGITVVMSMTAHRVQDSYHQSPHHL